MSELGKHGVVALQGLAMRFPNAGEITARIGSSPDSKMWPGRGLSSAVLLGHAAGKIADCLPFTATHPEHTFQASPFTLGASSVPYPLRGCRKERLVDLLGL